MELTRIAEDVYACTQEDRGLGWNNAGFVNLGGGLAVDTFYDLPRTRQMIDLYMEKSGRPARYLVNTHHNGDHTWGNQLFKDAEIIAHRLCAEEMEREKREDLLGLLQAGQLAPEQLPPQLDNFIDAMRAFDFSGIDITVPDRLIEDRLDLDLDGFPCELIYVGPAHSAGDLIVHLPEHRVVFAGDVIFNRCTPVGWSGTQAKWCAAIDFLISLDPEVIVPGHGPLCGTDQARDLKAYFEHVHSKARILFHEGLSPLDAAKQIDLGPYADWTEPERLVLNVARLFREFRGEPWDAPFGDPVELIGQAQQLRAHWVGS
jgi:glyoxylase-like metal-dependent hydrolase (beta-lactamase superfamily II)